MVGTSGAISGTSRTLCICSCPAVRCRKAVVRRQQTERGPRTLVQPPTAGSQPQRQERGERRQDRRDRERRAEAVAADAGLGAAAVSASCERVQSACRGKKPVMSCFAASSMQMHLSKYKGHEHSHDVRILSKSVISRLERCIPASLVASAHAEIAVLKERKQ